MYLTENLTVFILLSTYFRRDSTAIWLLCTAEFRLMRYSIFLGPFENLKRTIRFGKFDYRYFILQVYTTCQQQ